MRHVLIALSILILSGAAAGVSNSLRAKPLPWVREELPPVTQAPSTSGPTSRAGTQPQDTPPAKPGVVSIDIVLEQLRAGTATFVDAREDHEYVEGHFKGAIHLPSSDIYKSVDRLNFLGMVPPEAMVIVYCGGGDCEASHNVSQALRQDFNYKNVFVYEKGWAEVTQSGRFSEFIELGAAP